MDSVKYTTIISIAKEFVTDYDRYVRFAATETDLKLLKYWEHCASVALTQVRTFLLLVPDTYLFIENGSIVT